MFRGLIVYLIGVYSGVCICQNYEVPKMNNPMELLEKLKQYAEEKKK